MKQQIQLVIDIFKSNDFAKAETMCKELIEDNSKVVFGATVKVTDLNTGTKNVFKIVGADEADIEKNLISVLAPLCKAMINKRVDNVFEVPTNIDSQTVNLWKDRIRKEYDLAFE